MGIIEDKIETDWDYTIIEIFNPEGTLVRTDTVDFDTDKTRDFAYKYDIDWPVDNYSGKYTVVSTYDTEISETTFMYTAIEPDSEGWFSTQEPFVVYLEVRDLTTGYTIYNEFGIGMLEPHGVSKVAISWVPEQPGNYELRSIVFDNLQNTEWMSGIATLPIVIS
jgi:hypothetical protein